MPRSPFALLMNNREFCTALAAVSFFFLCGWSSAHPTRVNSQTQETNIAEKLFAEGEQLKKESTSQHSLEAIKKYEEAAAYWKSARSYQKVTQTYLVIGEIYQQLGNSREARRYYNEALQLSQTVKDRRLEGETLNKIAHLIIFHDRPQLAFEAVNQALHIGQALHDSQIEAAAHTNFGLIHYFRSDLPKSIEHYRKALSLWQTSSNVRGQAQALMQLGHAFSDLSEIQNALESFDQALVLWQKLTDKREQSLALTAIARLYSKLDRKQEALQLYSQAREISHAFEDQLGEAMILNGLAYTYSELGDKPKALEYYQQALQLYVNLGVRNGEAGQLLKIGEIHASNGNNLKALTYYSKALKLIRVLGDTRLESSALRYLGMIYETSRYNDSALTYYYRSLRLNRAGKDRRQTAYTLSNIAHVHESRGKIQKALGLYRQALSLSRETEDRFGELQALYNLSRAESKRNNLRGARTQIELSLAIFESSRIKVTSQELRSSYLASTHNLYEFYIDILMRLHRAHPQKEFEVAAFEASEKARARSLLESLREGRAGIRNGVDAELLKQERELLQQINAKADRHMRLANGKQTEEAEALAREISQLTAQHDQLKVKIKQTSPHYAALTQPQPLSLREIQQRVLDEDSLLLEYALGEERSYVWVITRTEIASFVLPGRAEIESLVRRCYELLIARPRTQQENIAAYQERIVREETEFQAKIATLSQMLLQQVAPKLTRKRLLVVADGALQYLPFQALLLPKPNEAEAAPLIAKYEIVNEPSASALAILLQETAGRKPAPNAVAVLADPVFEASDERVQTAGATTAKRSDPPAELQQTLRDVGVLQDNGKIPRLYASREEANAILALTPWRKGFSATDFEASRATFTNTDFSRFRIIHLATHGFLSNDHPEMSGIVLSLVDRQGKAQEGFLRQLDIYNLTLPVELVVLSACNTGLGKDVKGEGLVGLTRGFMYAGAASVVASLWKVDDNATAELMQHFYEGILKQGHSPAAALRQAQLAMLKQKRWRSPYYWAGFVIQGQYANSAVPQSTHLTPWLIACLVVGTVVSLFVLGLRWRRKQTQINAS
ncbi:MAG: CHAT domain-containing protein [Acidobacteria bacterium]|nr:CHAT domain-containing protein [Acidobacteriota bacterium]